MGCRSVCAGVSKCVSKVKVTAVTSAVPSCFKSCSKTFSADGSQHDSIVFILVYYRKRPAAIWTVHLSLITEGDAWRVSV